MYHKNIDRKTNLRIGNLILVFSKWVGFIQNMISTKLLKFLPELIWSNLFCGITFHSSNQKHLIFGCFYLIKNNAKIAEPIAEKNIKLRLLCSPKKLKIFLDWLQLILFHLTASNVIFTVKGTIFLIQKNC